MTEDELLLSLERRPIAHVDEKGYIWRGDFTNPNGPEAAALIRSLRLQLSEAQAREDKAKADFKKANENSSKLFDLAKAEENMAWNRAINAAADMCVAVDSGRGNEGFIATELRKLVRPTTPAVLETVKDKSNEKVL